MKRLQVRWDIVKAALWSWLKAAKYGVEILGYPLFRLRGSPPHRIGYQFYKHQEIRRHLPPCKFPEAIQGFHYGLHLDERVVEYPWFFSRLPEISGLLLDAGSALNFGYLIRHPSLRANRFLFLLWHRRHTAFGVTAFHMSTKICGKLVMAMIYLTGSPAFLPSSTSDWTTACCIPVILQKKRIGQTITWGLLPSFTEC